MRRDGGGEDGEEEEERGQEGFPHLVRLGVAGVVADMMEKSFWFLEGDQTRVVEERGVCLMFCEGKERELKSEATS